MRPHGVTAKNCPHELILAAKQDHRNLRANTLCLAVLILWRKKAQPCHCLLMLFLGHDIPAHDLGLYSGVASPARRATISDTGTTINNGAPWHQCPNA